MFWTFVVTGALIGALVAIAFFFIVRRIKDIPPPDIR
jgi:membrane-associated phospholipid phosphatase